MEISRRRFLGVASGSAATLLPFGALDWSVTGRRTDRRFGRALFEPPHCVLGESLQGYQSALGGERRYLSAGSVESQSDMRWIIVPSLGPLDSIAAQAVADFLYRGGFLILESAGGFLSGAEFERHQGTLRECFHLEVERPIGLWKGETDRHGGTPYVSYDWPRATMVRDFSSVVPVSGNSGEVIGSVGEWPVALKKKVGKGMLIFLGSPLGPLLRTGDREARGWLEAVTMQ